MIVITSADNRIFKLSRKLLVRKNRQKEGLYLIEGENLVEEAVSHNVPIEHIIICSGFEEKYAPLYGHMKGTVLMEQKLFMQISQTDTSQGILAVTAMQKITLEEFSKRASEGTNLLILDRLQDPGNIGTVIRTADAAGYAGIIVLKGTADIYSPKVIRAAAGSVSRMPVISMDSADQVLEFLRLRGKKSVSTCFDTDTWYYNTDLTHDIGLIIGNEGNGVSEQLIQESDIRVKIPMSGTIESLNAAVAAGILMYESMRNKI